MSVPASEVQCELERIVAANGFQRSPQMQRFLRFLVEEALSGRQDRLKEYVVATEVFGRSADYDPRLDSLVRVEAHRLRNLLEAHYRGPGSKDPVVIELSKGSYVPAFRYRTLDEKIPPVEVVPRALHVAPGRG